MKCPIDQTNLAMTDRQGIEVDYCPECRGVWLDRGELDKLIERAEGNAPTSRNEEPRESREHRNDDYRRDDHRSDDHHDYEKKKKKESFMGEFFDF